MGKSRGFKLGRKVVKIFKWVICPKRKPTRYKRLLNDVEAPQDYYCKANESSKTMMMTKIIHKWGQRLKRRAKDLCLLNSSSSSSAHHRRHHDHYYRRIDQTNEAAAQMDQQKHREVAVPKGHLVVYVKGGGDEEEEEEEQRRHRFLVPVLYFNHPLFGELLREAEKEYGFHQPGCITIPCPISEFQNVQARIAACRKPTWKHLL